MLHQMAAVAELEAGMISARPKCALAAAKARGVAPGGFRGQAGTGGDLTRARAERSRKAVRHAHALAPVVAGLDPGGACHCGRLRRLWQRKACRPPAGRGTGRRRRSRGSRRGRRARKPVAGNNREHVRVRTLALAAAAGGVTVPRGEARKP